MATQGKNTVMQSGVIPSSHPQSVKTAKFDGLKENSSKQSKMN